MPITAMNGPTTEHNFRVENDFDFDFKCAFDAKF